MNVAIAIPRATLADLARVEGKAELVGGRLVPIMPTGHRPGQEADAEPAVPGWRLAVGWLMA